MSNPSNLSLGGILSWSQDDANGTGQHPPENNINADMVDGMHYNDLKSEWELYADASGGGGRAVASGISAFFGNGIATPVSMGSGVEMPDTKYIVYIIPVADTHSKVGEFYVPESSKTTTSFEVVNEGSGNTSFIWAVLSIEDAVFSSGNPYILDGLWNLSPPFTPPTDDIYTGTLYNYDSYITMSGDSDTIITTYPIIDSTKYHGFRSANVIYSRTEAGKKWEYVAEISEGIFHAYLSYDGSTIIIPADSGSLKVYSYNKSTSSLSLDTTITPPGTDHMNRFSRCNISSDGTRILLVGYLEGVTAYGRLHIYDKQSSSWTDIFSSSSIAGYTDVSIAPLNNNVVSAGDNGWYNYGDPDEFAQSHIWRFDGSNWQHSTIKSSDLPSGSYDALEGDFSYVTALAGNGSRIFIASPLQNATAGNQGRVYVFDWDGSEWNYSTSLDTPDPVSNSEFGRTIKAFPDPSIVGIYARGENKTYLFKEINGNWSIDDTFTGSYIPATFDDTAEHLALKNSPDSTEVYIK